MLSQLSNKLCRSRRRGGISSTMDSGLSQPERQHGARKLLPSGTEERITTRSETLKVHSAMKVHSASTSPFPPTEEAPNSPEAKQAVLFAAPTENTNKKASIHINEGASAQHSIWRPW